MGARLANLCSAAVVVTGWRMRGSWQGASLMLVGMYLRSFLSGKEYSANGAWPAFQRWSAWKPITRFLFGECKLVVEEPEKLRACKQGILAVAPHGVVSFNHVLYITDAAGWLSRDVWPVDRRELGASVIFRIPLYRELLLWLGCVDASLATARRVLKSGRSLFVYPGGEAEQMRARPGDHIAYWESRKGFVKLALEFGIPLIPSYCFGENELFHPLNMFSQLRMALCNKFHVAIPLGYGRWGTLLPRKIPLVSVIGSPMEVPKMGRDDPDFSAKVDEVHAAFLEQTKALFDRHKAEYASEGAAASLRFLGSKSKKTQ